MNQAMVLTAIHRSQPRKGAFSDESREQSPEMEVHNQARIVLIDDDPVYGAIIGRWAQREGVAMDVFHSLEDLGFVGLLARYDVVIVDYDLGDMNGKEVADYMTTFFGNKPMVMISGVDRSQEMLTCPACVKAFMKKSAGYETILRTALRLRLEARSGRT